MILTAIFITRLIQEIAETAPSFNLTLNPVTSK
jgi:hypothetical protein